MPRKNIVPAARNCIVILVLSLTAAACAADGIETLQQYQNAHPEPLHDAGLLATEELVARFENAYEACFYTAEPLPARDLLAAVRELDSRKLTTPVQWADTYECLLTARLTAEATQVHAARNGERMGSLPRFAPIPAINPSAPSVWRIDVATRTLHREPVDLRGIRLVVVAHPNCGFSRNAVHAMSSDPQLKSLAASALWLAPGAGSFAWDRIHAWNAEHPESPLAYAWREQDWPMIDDWATPSFYFLRDGAVEERVHGWPAEGQAAALLDAARALEITPAIP